MKMRGEEEEKREKETDNNDNIKGLTMSK